MIKSMHYYYLLPSSVWPFLSSLGSYNFFMSLFFFLKFNALFSFVLSTLLIFFLCMFWWTIYSMEFTLEGKNSYPLETGLKMSMILFISSEAFFFFSFFWSYFHFFFSPSMELGLIFPPINLEFFDFTSVPLINTLILMSSGLTITISHSLFLLNKKSMGSMFMLITVCLGVLFTFFQLSEYNSAFFSVSDGTFGSTFFVLTGFHGVHVFVGTLFLMTSLYRLVSFNSSSSSLLSFELSSWYWHFVDVVWIFLYFFLYYMVI